MTTLHMEERLWEYIDGLSNEEEKTSVNLLLHTHPEWKAKYDELMELNKILHSSELEEPSMRFSQAVMEEIGKYHIAPATKTYINKKIIYGLGGFFISTILGMLVYLIAQLNWTAETTLTEGFSYIQIGKVMNDSSVNIFLMINLVAGLMLLDRYLAGKKERLLSRQQS